MDVLAKIKRLMRERRWTEYKLAKESNLSQSTISNLFLRNTLPTIPTLEAICNAFNMTLSEFFMDEQEKTEQTLITTKLNRLNKDQKKLIISVIDNIVK